MLAFARSDKHNQPFVSQAGSGPENGRGSCPRQKTFAEERLAEDSGQRNAGMKRQARRDGAQAKGG
jgi:hypothetical protein